MEKNLKYRVLRIGGAAVQQTYLEVVRRNQAYRDWAYYGWGPDGYWYGGAPYGWW